MHAPDHLPYQDWGVDGTGLAGEPLAGWAGYDFPVPPGWRSGVYLAALETGDGRRRLSSPDARHGRVLFVVLGSGAPILHKLPLFTFHAYNQVSAEPYDPVSRRGGWCLYTLPEPHEVPVPVPPTVSVRRPGGGTGRTPWDSWNADPYDPTPRQTFVHWDAPFIAWLERSGYQADYCTDLDLHEDRALLDPDRLLVSVGHDEYWSDEMRGAVARFAARGGNVAFFSGNTCWKRVVFDDPVTFRRLERWPSTPVRDPENALTGVSFRNGGERDLAHGRVPIGFRVQHADHWVYAGTGLRDGDVFGAEEALVGYECDGAHFDRADLDRGVPVRPTGLDGTPPDFLILGVGDVRVGGWARQRGGHHGRALPRRHGLHRLHDGLGAGADGQDLTRGRADHPKRTRPPPGCSLRRLTRIRMLVDEQSCTRWSQWQGDGRSATCWHLPCSRRSLRGRCTPTRWPPCFASGARTRT